MALTLASRRRLVSVTLIGACLLGAVGATAHQSLEYRVKAAFLYNFLTFIDWPASAFTRPDDPIRVCIIGYDPFGAELDAINGERIGRRPIVVERLKDEEASGSCRLLFLSASDDVRLPTVRRASAGRGVLIVTEDARTLDGCAGIALVVEDSRVRFDVNMAALRSEKLTPSSKLLRVARARVDRPARCALPGSR
jgi:hypothetical protein